MFLFARNAYVKIRIWSHRSRWARMLWLQKRHSAVHHTLNCKRKHLARRLKPRSGAHVTAGGSGASRWWNTIESLRLLDVASPRCLRQAAPDLDTELPRRPGSSTKPDRASCFHVERSSTFFSAVRQHSRLLVWGVVVGTCHTCSRRV